MKVELVPSADGMQLHIDGERIQKPRPVQWRGLTVIAELDGAIKKASGRDVFHLSVSAERRRPTDDEAQEAIDEWVPRGMTLLEQPSAINPCVRHFFDAEALP